MTMKERIESGKLFTDMCEGMPEERMRAKMLMKQLNDSPADDFEGRAALINSILGYEAKCWIEPPFYFCYGTHMEIGENTYINVNCNFIDDGKIKIGRGVMFGPACTVATVGHPIDPSLRAEGLMYAAPVEIEDNAWICANVVICPGVKIGKNAVIGAGSVVTRDIPANCVAAGNPCKVIREIGQKDKEFYFRDMKIDADDLAEEKALR